MSFEVNCTVAGSHPALAGHFPGDPVVPGVLILDEVMQAARQWRGHDRLKRIVSVKFTSKLAPGREFTIRLRESGPSEIAFECLLEGAALASGRLEVEPGASES